MTSGPVVHTSLGRLRGTAEDGLAVFRGIPYAACPTGDLRWQAPRSHQGWSGIRNATEYGATAPQPYIPGGNPIMGEHGMPPFGEDCLTLNVWTPAVDDARRPVLVWIHGGGFLTGSGNIPYYAGDTFARDGDLVVVAINYRLGPLGFLHGMGDSANLWLADQAAALRWVADNIAAFGGDPGSITVAGQSGGAFSIGGLLQHPVSRGLIQRAVVQSAPMGLDLPAAEEAFDRTQALARLLGHDDVEALRAEPVDRLVEGALSVLMEYAQFGGWDLAFLPVLDDATMPRHPREALVDADIDVLTGWTEDEATFRFALDPRYADLGRDEVVDWIGKHHADPQGVYDAYATGLTSPRDVLIALVSDDLMRRHAVDFVDRRAARGHLYVYEFRLDSPAMGGVLGATHCLELPFTFRNHDRWDAGFLDGFADDVVARVGDQMHRAWIAFARTGRPGLDDLPWPAYTTTEKNLMVFDVDSGVVVDPSLPWQAATQ